jgi:hypothetical protein
MRFPFSNQYMPDSLGESPSGLAENVSVPSGRNNQQADLKPGWLVNIQTQLASVAWVISFPIGVGTWVGCTAAGLEVAFPWQAAKTNTAKITQITACSS